MVKPEMETYLKAIYHLQSAPDDRVQTSSLADSLDVSPPTVTTMLKRLAEQDLIDRKEYEGVTLTSQGKHIALEVIRRHRLLELFLSEHLDYSLPEIHDEADRLEHHVSDQFVQRIAGLLDDPEVDPHGDPIPNADLEKLEQRGMPLDTRAEGETVDILRVNDRHQDVLEYLSNRDIRPGTRIEIIEVAPIGMMTVRAEGAQEPISIPESAAQHIRVRPDDNGSTNSDA